MRNLQSDYKVELHDGTSALIGETLESCLALPPHENTEKTPFVNEK